MGLLLVSVKPAWANQPPGPHLLLAEILILPLMMLFTVLGGGYVVMRKRGIKNIRWVGPIVAVLAILLSFTGEEMAAALMVGFGAFVVWRGATMIFWGIAATRQPEKRAPYLAGASPVRLITAGLASWVAAVGLAGMSFAFVGWWPFEQYVESDLKRLVAYELVTGNKQKDSTGRPQYEAPRFVLTVRSGYFAEEFNLGQGAKSFHVWVWPQRMPFFPYNYVVTLPSFYADETGQIRMVRVHKNGQRCPADAPVYYHVTPADLEARD